MIESNSSYSMRVNNMSNSMIKCKHNSNSSEASLFKQILKRTVHEQDCLSCCSSCSHACCCRCVKQLSLDSNTIVVCLFVVQLYLTTAYLRMTDSNWNRHPTHFLRGALVFHSSQLLRIRAVHTI